MKVAVGRRPNGLSFDPGRGTLLAANVGDPDDPSSHTLSIVDTARAAMVASIPVAGRTRWTVFDASSDRFFVNIADPASIVVVEGADPIRVTMTIPVPAAGPHGLEIDEAGRLYCACDAGRLLVLAPPAYEVVADLPLAGPPDVIFLDSVPGLRSQHTFFFQGSSPSTRRPSRSGTTRRRSSLGRTDRRHTSARWTATGRPATPTGPRSRASPPSAATGRGTAGTRSPWRGARARWVGLVGRRPPPRPVALDREAPPGERAVEGGATTTAQLVWILGPRLPEPDGVAQSDDR